jgi:hypothetical protein
MITPLTTVEQDALDYLYGGGDQKIECRSARWVVTLKPHDCLSVLHKGALSVSSPAPMVLQKAKVDGQFGSCYTCQECINAAVEELRRN